VPGPSTELLTPLRRPRIPASTVPPGFTTRQKILAVGALDDALASRRAAGQRIAMTNGCFDLLHPGHVASLEFARGQGDCLVVGLNSDRSARALKGPGHPVVDQQGRAAMLAALACVDYVVVFDETSVAGLVDRVAPDVLVKSAEYAIHEVVGHESVLAHGGRVILSPREGDYSTTRLIERIVRMRRAESGKRVYRQHRRAG
jgi:rfaE bifunctional protein nucleotidyltransferase chain/domain